ncbi:MAG: hypothetical protein ACLPN5_05790 [Roseiarcus sp.]
MRGLRFARGAAIDERLEGGVELADAAAAAVLGDGDFSSRASSDSPFCASLTVPGGSRRRLSR